MKGILLAGGTGSRLYPLTKTLSKQLLPVYDKPMIYYPLSTLMLFDIRDILIISTPRDIPNIQNLFGDGSYIGLNIQYAIQEKPDGIANAFTIGADFVKKNDDDVCLILGDNIFYIGDQLNSFKNEIDRNKGKNATIFAYHVPDPKRFGVIEFDKNHKVVSIEEKPANPKSNYVSVGLYVYPRDVVEKVKLLKPSARNELEITDLNNLYLKENRLSAVPMKRGNAWLDAGTPESLMESSNFIQIIEQRQGLKVACIEEIAYHKGFINDKKMKTIIEEVKNCNYKTYLQKIYEEQHELY